MNRFMTHTISEDIIYYGVYSTSDDMWNGGDVLCAARKRFFETGTKQKKRSTIKTDSGTYSYSYVIESGTLLKYKKTKSGHTAEQTVQTPDGYCVEQFNDRHQIVKRSCYNRLHCWQRTEYLSDGMTALCITPSPDSETPALICESNGTSEVLYPFEVTLDKELTEKLNIMTHEPKVFCVTDCGSFYCCTEEELKARKEALDKLLRSQESEPVQKIPDTESAFVINTAFLEKTEQGGFDLRSSREVRLSDTIEKEAVQTAASEEMPSEVPPEPENGIETETAVCAEMPSEVPQKPANSVETAESEQADTREEMLPEAAETGDFFEAMEKIVNSVLEKNRQTVIDTEDMAAEQPAISVETAEQHKVPAQTAEQAVVHAEMSEQPAVSAETEQLSETAEPPQKNDGFFEKIEAIAREALEKDQTVSAESLQTVSEEKSALIPEQTVEQDGFGVIRCDSGQLSYVGGCSQGKRQGLGAAFSSSDGSMTAGRWEDDQITEVSSCFDKEGHLLYTGGVRNGQRHGAGLTYNPQDGTFFLGKYRDGVFLETGTQFDSSGELLYAGGYRNNARSGEGTAYNADGTVRYRGEWLHNVFHGKGILYTKDGSIIAGRFRNGKADGQCTLTNALGRVIYIGSFADGRYNGSGQYFSEDGSYVEGQFSDGEPTGIFNEYSAEKKLVYCGEWYGRERSGRGIAYENGEKRYEGEFLHSLYHGEGKLYQNGEVVYVGSFKEGRRDGFGTAYCQKEIRYKGQWHNDSYNGCGILYENGEARYVGFFRDGRRDGRINEIARCTVIRKSLFTNDERTYSCTYDKEGALVYHGSMSGEQRNGMGCSFGEHTEKQFEGIFRQDRPDKPMKVFLKDLPELPPCDVLADTEYELYRLTPEYVIEKNIIVDGVPAVYSGMLKNGLPDGSGTILYTDHRYTGYFSEGHPEGEGIVYLNTGEERKGFFSAKPFEDCQPLVLSGFTYYCRLKIESGK